MNHQVNTIYVPIKHEMICYHNTSHLEQNEAGLPYHHHDAYEIYLFISGNTRMYLEDACYRLAPGDLILIRPGEMHRSVCIDNRLYERIGLNIKHSVLERLSSPRSDLSNCFNAGVSDRNHNLRLTSEQMAHYVSLADKLSACLRSDQYGHDILAESHLAQLLVFINLIFQGAAYRADNLMPPLVSGIMAFVKEHLTETITSDQLEREFHYSGKHISQIFREHTGLTLRSYIIDQRISLAKNLLDRGKTVAEACELSGFNDYANFIRSFKKMVGLPPGKFRSRKSG